MDSLYPSLYFLYFEIFHNKKLKRNLYEEIIPIEYRIILSHLTMNMYFLSFSIYLITVSNFAIK